MEPKRERDQAAMDIDVVQMQGLADKDAKEKQCTKGRCFLCNRQGLLQSRLPLFLFYLTISDLFSLTYTVEQLLLVFQMDNRLLPFTVALFVTASAHGETAL